MYAENTTRDVLRIILVELHNNIIILCYARLLLCISTGAKDTGLVLLVPFWDKGTLLLDGGWKILASKKHSKLERCLIQVRLRSLRSSRVAVCHFF